MIEVPPPGLSSTVPIGRALLTAATNSSNVTLPPLCAYNVQLSGRAPPLESATRAHNEMERSRRRRDAV
jgi:hypothetical protein